MKRWTGLLLLLLLVAGCGGGAYKMPPEEYRRQVQTLGVLPLLFDEGSVILHPRRQEVVRLVRQANEGKAGRLIELLREQKMHFDVRPVDGDPRRLFDRLGITGSVQGKGDDRHRLYGFDAAAVAELARREVVDALLVVIEYGALRQEKRWDRLGLNFLEDEFNSLLTTAVVVLPSGRIAWEYRTPPGKVFLPLQYPDFDEAHYNLTEAVRTKFISLEGLERRLSRQERGILGGQPFVEVYRDLFGRILDSLEPKKLQLRPASGG